MIELTCFSGLPVVRIGEVQQVSVATIDRDRFPLLQLFRIPNLRSRIPEFQNGSQDIRFGEDARVRIRRGVNNFGYNTVTGQFGDMIELGILDPRFATTKSPAAMRGFCVSAAFCECGELLA